MDVKMVLMFVAIALLLILVISYIMRPNSALTSISDGKTMQTVKAEDLAGSDSGTTTSHFTYSIWFYVDDWNYRYGEPKTLFGRSGKTAPDKSEDDEQPTLEGSSGGSDVSTLGGPPEPSPAVIFGAIENSMSILLTCYDSTSASDTGIIHNCNVPNIPLQKWTNLIISAYGRALDVYVPGSFSRFKELATIEDETKIPNAINMLKKLEMDNQKVIASLAVGIWRTCQGPENRSNIAKAIFFPSPVFR